MTQKISWNLTCVSAYWKVNNKHGNNYEQWFHTTLKVHCPYVFFSDKETIEIIKKYRANLPTTYVEYNIKDFFTYNYKDKMKTHPQHCPSIELNLIWNEKIFLIQKALQINPYHSDYFMWIDAGICTLRNRMPPPIRFPNINTLSRLPKDKFIYSASQPYNHTLFKKGQYHLHHYISGTYMLHKNIINTFVEIYKCYLHKLVDKSDIWTDQVILTHIYKDKKELFYKLSDGYGTILYKLF